MVFEFLWTWTPVIIEVDASPAYPEDSQETSLVLAELSGGQIFMRFEGEKPHT